MVVSHYKITQAGLISAFTFIVGQLVAFVPSLGTDKQNLISAGSAAISAAFLIANAIHAANSKPQIAPEGSGGQQWLAARQPAAVVSQPSSPPAA